MANLDFFQAAGLTYEDVVSMAERDVRRPESQLFKAIESELAEMLGATVTNAARESVSKRRRRVYVPHTVDQAKLYKLTVDYPEWDLQFTAADKTSASLARAIFQLSTEKLFDFTGPDKSELVAFGCTVNYLVTRNRKWAHVCLPIADSAVFRDAIMDDRAMRSIMSAAERAGKTVPLAVNYRTAQFGSMTCAKPSECTHSARMALMMLHRTPTNFRQVCAFMQAHSSQVLYFAVPWNKAMETGIDGPFPELDAHVLHGSEFIDLVYKNAQDLDTRFQRSSYLELITRTSLVIGGMVYTKEHVDYVNGIAFYRVVATENKFDSPAPVYRSWLNPAYREYYSVKAFVPKNEYVDMTRADSYVELLFDVHHSLLHPLIEFGMSLDTKENVPIVYRRKLRSLTSNIQVHGTIVTSSQQLDVREYKAVAMLAFTHVFMQRYATGETVKALVSRVKRHFSLQSAGAWRVFVASVGRLAYYLYDATMDSFLTKLNAYWRRISASTVPVGSFEQTVGFKEYVPNQPNPWSIMSYEDGLTGMSPSGFYPHLPGASQLSFLYAKHVLPRPTSFAPVLVASDQRNLELELASAMSETDGTTLVTSLESVPTKSIVESDLVENLTKHVVTGYGRMVDPREVQLQAVVPFQKKNPPPVVHAGKSDNVVHDLYYVLERFFPGSTILKTEHFPGDLHYGPLALLVRAHRLSVDISKLEPLRPEKVYKPVVHAHVMPNLKNTLQNVLYAVVKRNLNTPNLTDPMGVEEVWQKVWKAMCRVYFVPEAVEMLDSMDYKGPTYENVREWVSNIPDDKRERLLHEDFSPDELDMVKNEMILKAKMKPSLGTDYATAVKPGQSIVYDVTGKRVAVFSPLIGEKVRRMQAVLMPNILIMQRKSPAQITEFLCRFDHRPRGSATRKYLELDGSMFDKSQGLMAKSMHWNILAMFRILPMLLDLIRSAGSALDASSVRAGVRVMTPPERETGAADTLDGNTDVSMAIYATFLEQIVQHIEFVMIMGDDVTIAFRGDIDLSSLENDVARTFNISVKYIISDYGYFCSGFIVHLPDGLSRWIPDVVKRVLDYCSMSVNEETDMRDKFESHHDLCKGIEDFATQEFLKLAVPARYKHVSSVIDDVAVGIACRLISTVKDDFDKYTMLLSNILSKRNQ